LTKNPFLDIVVPTMKKTVQALPRRAVDGLKAATRHIPKPLHRPLRLVFQSACIAFGIYVVFVGSTAVAIYTYDADNKVVTFADHLFPYPAAIVNRRSIPLSRLRLEVRARLVYAGQHGLSTDRTATEKTVINQLINRALYADALNKAGIIVSDSDVTAKLNEIYSQIGSESDLVSFLHQNYGEAIGIEQFKVWVKESLVEAAVKQQVLEHATVSHILVAIPSDATPDQIESARVKAVSIKSKITADQPFATIAKQFSEDVASRDNNGQLGVTVRGDDAPVYSADFQNTVFTLPVGQVSDPVRSTYGWHLILVTDRSGNIDLSLKDYTAQLRDGHVRTLVGK
jgi:PPIC-type PPIASE domain